MSIRNTLSLAARRILAPLGIRLVRITPNKIRGIEPLFDLKYLLRESAQPVIFDVGANDGEMVEELLEVFPSAKIVAFEPFLKCYEILRNKFADHENVRVENIALGAQDGTGKLNVFEANRMNSLLMLDDAPDNVMKGHAQVGTEEVAIATLDQFCTVNGIDHVDVLKVDTQGFDLEVLKGAQSMLTERRIRCVLLEVNFIPMYEAQGSFIELHGLLQSHGYGLIDFYNQVRVGDHTSWCDACYVSGALTHPAGAS